MKKINLAINGFGRIGRSAFKIISDNFPNINVVAINDLASTDTLAYLLKYDSVYGVFSENINYTKEAIIVEKKKIPVFSIKDPKAVSYTHLRAHETDSYLVCRLLLEKKK